MGGGIGTYGSLGGGIGGFGSGQNATASAGSHNKQVEDGEFGGRY